MADILAFVMLGFALLGALDRMLGNKLGLGAEFERGFSVFGNLALSMIGMIALAPSIALLLEPVLPVISAIGLDPSIIAGSLLANDMGGASLSAAVAGDAAIGAWSGLIVGATMGCTVSFTIPYATELAPKDKRSEVLLGFAAGIVTIPIGAFLGGLAAGIALIPLFINCLPLIVVAVIVCIALLKKTELCVKIFTVLGKIMQVIITAGLALAMIAFVTGVELLPSLGPIEEGAMICFNAAVTLAGAFPLINIVSRLLNRPLGALGAKFGINENSAVGFLATIATASTTLPLMAKMDRKGIVLNAAFIVSAGFGASHLAFTLAFSADAVVPMLVGKLSGGIFAVVVAAIIFGIVEKKKPDEKNEPEKTECEA